MILFKMYDSSCRHLFPAQDNQKSNVRTTNARDNEISFYRYTFSLAIYLVKPMVCNSSFNINLFLEARVLI